MSESERESPGHGAALPTTPAALFARLDALGIAHRTVEHAPVFTVEQARAARGGLGGGHIKNLFLRDKPGRMWLLSCPEDRRLDLKQLAPRIAARHLSFASRERLWRHLGVEPGAVTPFALINDAQGAVQAVLDRALLAAPTINAHPLVNHLTTCIAPADLVRFLESVGHPPQLIDLL